MAALGHEARISRATMIYLSEAKLQSGHDAISPIRWINAILGISLHTFVLTPYYSWRITHRHHHVCILLCVACAWCIDTHDACLTCRKVQIISIVTRRIIPSSVSTSRRCSKRLLLLHSSSWRFDSSCKLSYPLWLHFRWLGHNLRGFQLYLM